MADPLRWVSKDPDAVVMRAVNWTPKRWGNDTILTVATQVVTGDVVVSASSVASSGQVPGARPGQGTLHWLSGGTAESTVRVRVTTADGRTEDQTCIIALETK